MCDLLIFFSAVTGGFLPQEVVGGKDRKDDDRDEHDSTETKRPPKPILQVIHKNR